MNRPAPTFRERVDAFWQWFEDVGPRFYKTIEAGKCPELSEEVTAFMQATLPGFAWSFGPGDDGGHAFTVSGEGIRIRQLLAESWRCQAPEIRGWTFYSARKASDDLDQLAIEIQDQGSVDCENFLIGTNVDQEAELLDIVAWHPMYEQLPEEPQSSILFLLLDEALGEFGTQTWIGEIEIAPIDADVDGKTVHRLSELPRYIRHVQDYYRWEKLSPLESHTVYQLPEPVDELRLDTIAGVTRIPDLLSEYLESGTLEDAEWMELLGVSMEFLRIDSQVIPEGQESEARGNIEDAIDEALQPEGLGQTLGGAQGINHTYIDVLLADGERSRQRVEEALARLNLAGHYDWHSMLESEEPES